MKDFEYPKIQSNRSKIVPSVRIKVMIPLKVRSKEKPKLKVRITCLDESQSSWNSKIMTTRMLPNIIDISITAGPNKM